MAKVFDRVAIDSWLNDEIVRKFPQGGLGDIKLGSPCIVNPNEIAVFVRGGKPWALSSLAPMFSPPPISPGSLTFWRKGCLVGPMSSPPMSII